MTTAPDHWIRQARDIPPLAATGMNMLSHLTNSSVGNRSLIDLTDLGHTLFVGLLRLTDKAVEEFAALGVQCREFEVTKTDAIQFA
jgi:hypothetical protein